MRTLLGKLRQRWAIRKLLKAHRQEKEGFAWACTELLLKNRPVEEVENLISGSRDFSNYNAFDKGAEKAINLLELNCKNLLTYMYSDPWSKS